MKLKFLITIFILNTSLYIFADVDYEDYFVGYTHLYISEDMILYENIAGLGFGDYIYPEKIQVDNYEMVNRYGLPFVVKDGEDIFLMLSNDEIVYLYSKETVNNNILRPILIGENKTIEREILLSSPRGRLEASSYLTEGETEYSVKNIKSTYLNKPWVEGVPGYGIGEFVLVEFKMNIRENPNSNANGMYLFNGYVSFDKPHLYEYNSRVKQMKAEDLDTGEQWIIDLNDTPSPQYIDFSDHEGHTIKLIIKDIYPGTKWEDTCINSILLTYRDVSSDISK